MTQARTAMLAGIAAALGADVEQRRAAVASWSQRRRPAPLPSAAQLAAHELLDAFTQRATAAAALVQTIPAAAALESSVLDALSRWQLEREIAVSAEPLLAQWLGGSSQLRLHHGRPRATDRAALVVPECAIAETGTLMFASGASMPTSLAFLPEYLIGVLPASRIVASYEQALDQLRREHATGWPRCVNFVTGPSRTADIEEVLLLGAHGPRAVLILIIPSL